MDLRVSDLVYVLLGHLNEKHVARHIAYNRAIKEERIRHSVQNMGGFFPWQFGYTRLSLLNSQQALTGFDSACNVKLAEWG